MKFTVKKASSYEYFEIVEISDLDQLMQFVEKEGSVVIQDNDDFYESVEVIQEWRGITKKEAEEIKSIKHEILIYDDYLE
jgi:spore coat polysaccharide biosynthesis predicted glycosyltransferase SpsG